MKIKSRKKWTALNIILSLVVGLLSGLGTVTTPVQAAGYGLMNPITVFGVTTWDCVWFGSYWQNDTNGDGKADKNDSKQPIKWRVLSVNGDDAFLLADQCLDCQQYNEEFENITWETCTLRTWLNNDFYSAAFSSAEQSAINKTSVVNEDNPYYEIEGGNNTEDKVYLLSLSEVANSFYGFSTDIYNEDEARYAKATEYAKNQGVWDSTDTDYEGNSWWWLRSPGDYSSIAADVNDHGCVGYNGNIVNFNMYGVRPALHLNLSSSQWSHAGIAPTLNLSTTNKLSSQKITTAKIKTYKAKKLKKKKVSFNLKAKTSGDGKLTYSVKKIAKKLRKYIKVSKKGKVTLKKKTKKGTYKILITASKTSRYKEAKKIVKIKVK